LTLGLRPRRHSAGVKDEVVATAQHNTALGTARLTTRHHRDGELELGLVVDEEAGRQWGAAATCSITPANLGFGRARVEALGGVVAALIWWSPAGQPSTTGRIWRRIHARER
jgi:hypothetical protein